NRLAKFDTAGDLMSFDPNISGTVYALALNASGNLYAGGQFTTVGGTTPRNCLVQFDTAGVLTSFDPNIGNPPNGDAVYALALDVSGNLYAGGRFDTVGGISRNHLAKFDTAGVLTSFNPNMCRRVEALVFDVNVELYAGGLFNTDGEAIRKRVTHCDRSDECRV